MWCVLVRYADNSGVVMVLGPWRTEDEALDVARTLGAFSHDDGGKVCDAVEMKSVILPATVE